MEQPAMEQVESLFAQYGDAVHAYAQARVGSGLAADIVSETFVVAWRRRDDVPDPGLPWLLATARRVAATHLRTQRRQESLRRKMQALAERESDQVTADELDPELLLALDHLRERDREALLLVAWFDLSHTEAADVQGCRPGTFAVRLHRARQRLIEQLNSRGYRSPFALPHRKASTDNTARREVL